MRSGRLPGRDTVRGPCFITPHISPLPSMKHLPPVFLLDDSEDDLVFTTKAIARSGCKNQIIAFTVADEAVQAFEGHNLRNTPVSGTFFCDLRLPGRHGAEIILHVKKLERCKRLRIFALTTAEVASDRKRALAAGAEAMLIKFPSPDEFARIIRG